MPFSKNNDVFAYLCPICKTPNTKYITYCIKCGHWLLDSNIQAIPLSKKEYFKIIKHGSYRKNKNSIFKMWKFWAITIAFILYVIRFISPKVNNIDLTVPMKYSAEFNQHSISQVQIITFSNIVAKRISNIIRIDGEVKNNDTKEHTFNMNIEIYDEKGKLIGTAEGGEYNIAAGETKKFTVETSRDYPTVKKVKIQVDKIIK